MDHNKVKCFFIHTNTFPSTNKSESFGPSSQQHVDLPLLSTLPTEVQTSILRFFRPQDRQMSLASALLKCWFIHQTAHVPWDEIVISRTPDPHKRPYWDPETAPTSANRAEKINLEFNVSHQAGLVGLAGSILPPGCSPPLTVTVNRQGSTNQTVGAVSPNPLPTSSSQDNSDNSSTPSSLRVGIDITCTTESSRNPTVTTTKELHDYISIFTEVFSPSEISNMKFSPLSPAPPPGTSGLEVLQLQLRRFYTFFALKEAYVKMTGEALLADWLKQVEFRNVRVPSQGPREGEWAEEVERGSEVWFKGAQRKEVELVIRGWGPGYIVSTAIDGGHVEDATGQGDRWKFLDWENDIRPCAMGECSCLNTA